MCSSETDSLRQVERLTFTIRFTQKEGSYTIEDMYTDCSLYIHSTPVSEADSMFLILPNPGLYFVFLLSI